MSSECDQSFGPVSYSGPTDAPGTLYFRHEWRADVHRARRFGHRSSTETAKPQRPDREVAMVREPEIEAIIAAAVDTSYLLAGDAALATPYFGADAQQSPVPADDYVLTDTEERARKLYAEILEGTEAPPGLESLPSSIDQAYRQRESDLYALRKQTVRALASLLSPSSSFTGHELASLAKAARDRSWGSVASFSPKVFVDLTRLCRDKCKYCTFVRNPLSTKTRSSGRRRPAQSLGDPRTSPAGSGRRAAQVLATAPSLDTSGPSVVDLSERPVRPPVRGAEAKNENEAYLRPEQVVELAATGRAAGCWEALFTLGDRPEERYPQARRFLREAGFDSTSDYLMHCASLVLDETGMLPHLNPGVMTFRELSRYRTVAPSAGMMLESTSWRLYSDPAGCHFGCVDKNPAVRVAVLEAAGAAKVPFTTGVLVGIGETLEERADTLLVIAAAARRWGHIQEVIVQNFRAKPRIPMRDSPEPTFDELARTAALARLLMPPEVAVQAPPNLTPRTFDDLLDWGLSDWGGISPITPDFVNPEAPWPQIEELSRRCLKRGYELRPRLCVYPAYVRSDGWISDRLAGPVDRASDAQGWARVEGPLARSLDNSAAGQLFGSC